MYIVYLSTSKIPHVVTAEGVVKADTSLDCLVDATSAQVLMTTTLNTELVIWIITSWDVSSLLDYKHNDHTKLFVYL